MKRFVVAAAGLSVLSACADAGAPPPAASEAQSVCYQNFTIEGTPTITKANYRSRREFPGLVDQQRALNNIRSALMADGLSNIGLDRHQPGSAQLVQGHRLRESLSAMA